MTWRIYEFKQSFFREQEAVSRVCELNPHTRVYQSSSHKELY